MFDNLMVAFDGTEPSRRALRAGIALAKRLGSPLRTITVLEDNPIFLAGMGTAPETMNEIRCAAESFAEDLRVEASELAKANDVEIECEAVYGPEVDGIVEAVRRHKVDTLIVGLRAHPGLINRLVCHTVRDLSEQSPCNVLGVK